MKAKFSASLIQTLVSRDPSEIILKSSFSRNIIIDQCWQQFRCFVVLETMIKKKNQDFSQFNASKLNKIINFLNKRTDPFLY